MIKIRSDEILRDFFGDVLREGRLKQNCPLEAKDCMPDWWHEMGKDGLENWRGRLEERIIFQAKIMIKIFFSLCLVMRFQDQDHIWWKALNFSSEMFLEIGNLSKMINC